MIKRYFLGLFFAICGQFLLAQKSTMDNGVINIGMDTTLKRGAFTLSANSGFDTSLIENLSYWIFAKNRVDSFLSIKNAINHNDIGAGVDAMARQGSIISVTQDEINQHKSNYKNINYQTPIGISNWPADNNLAAYINRNGAEGYQADEGDVPFIRGNHCLLSINNDMQNRKSTFSALNILSLQYFFTFIASGNPILDKTMGFRWVFQNRSGLDYTDVKFGVHFHALLSQLNSNYIGTDVKNNAMFAYNGNDTGQFMSVLLLNRSMQSSMYYVNSGQSANKNDIPLKTAHFVNYLNNRWKDGTQVKVGSTGIVGDSVAHFVFYNNTIDNATIWTENIVGNQKGDRNGLLISDIDTWRNNEIITIEGAVLISDNTPGFTALYQRHAALKNAYSLGNFTSVSSIQNTTVGLFPNPLSKGELLNIETESQIDKIVLYDLNGKVLITQDVENSGKTTLKNINYSGIHLLKIQFSNGNFKLVKLHLLP